jgi:hypothetical protein
LDQSFIAEEEAGVDSGTAGMDITGGIEGLYATNAKKRARGDESETEEIADEDEEENGDLEDDLIIMAPAPKRRKVREVIEDGKMILIADDDAEMAIPEFRDVHYSMRRRTPGTPPRGKKAQKDAPPSPGAVRHSTKLLKILQTRFTKLGDLSDPKNPKVFPKGRHQKHYCPLSLAASYDIACCLPCAGGHREGEGRLTGLNMGSDGKVIPLVYMDFYHVIELLQTAMSGRQGTTFTKEDLHWVLHRDNFLCPSFPTVGVGMRGSELGKWPHCLKGLFAMWAT